MPRRVSKSERCEDVPHNDGGAERLHEPRKYFLRLSANDNFGVPQLLDERIDKRLEGGAQHFLDCTAGLTRRHHDAAPISTSPTPRHVAAQRDDELINNRERREGDLEVIVRRDFTEEEEEARGVGTKHRPQRVRIVRFNLLGNNLLKIAHRSVPHATREYRRLAQHLHLRRGYESEHKLHDIALSRQRHLQLLACRRNRRACGCCTNSIGSAHRGLPLLLLAR